MSIEIKINGQSQGAAYIGWSPVACSIGLTARQAQRVQVVLRSAAAQAGGGAVIFRTSRTTQGIQTLSLTLPADGSAVNFYVAGSKASIEDRDTSITAADATTSTILGQQSLMVRVRKNANELTDSERD